VKIEARLEDETVRLTQQHMAELFQTTQQNISLHIQNVGDEGELQRAATHKESLSVRQEGERHVKHQVDFYNLDPIISVGYRIKSAVAILPMTVLRRLDAVLEPKKKAVLEMKATLDKEGVKA
jgi:hypothetical protein